MPFLRKVVVLGVAAVVVAGATSPAGAKPPAAEPVVTNLVTFAAPGCEGTCGSGSAVGPDHALYVTDGKAGSVLRIDPRTGAVSTFATGLPPQIAAVGLGGAIDVEFIGRTAYVLVTLVGTFFGQPADVVSGIYRVNRDGTVSPIADIGAWSIAHPPATDFFVASGLQYAMQKYRNGFLVTDGHHNRVLRVTLDGVITEFRTFANVAPTGLDIRGSKVYVSQAGPVPHVPETGKVVSFRASGGVQEVASGAPLLVDVEFGRGNRMYALSQGLWTLPNVPENAGAPASPDSGALLRVGRDGSLTLVAEELDRPTSVEFIGSTAFVVTLTGTVVRIDNA